MDVASKKKAFQVIILFGLISLFGDIVYEGGRSINGPYLKVLAANAAVVGFVAGTGEFLGYALRLLSGYFSDKTRSYWFFTSIGYGLIVFIPLLGMTAMWQTAAFFIVMERIGKAIRSPSRDAILASASRQVGTGFGFGLHEAMDQIGALTGPLVLTAFFTVSAGIGSDVFRYQQAYRLLWVPFVMLAVCIILAYARLPKPEILEEAGPGSEKLSRVFWLYAIFIFITTAGFANFVLISYHFKAQGVLTDAQIPLFYALAMGVDAVVALAIGKSYDILKRRHNHQGAGLDLLIIIPMLSLLLPFCAFSRSLVLGIVAVILWGVIMGAHETIMRSAIADITPIKKRGTGYGIFNTSYGLAFFLGSVTIGFLYERSIPVLIAAVVTVQVLALPVFFLIKKEIRREA